MANKIFKIHLNKFKPLAEVKKLYEAVLLEGYREHRGLIIDEKKKSLEQIAVYEKKLTVARNLLVTEKIDAEDYHLMKIEYNAVISKLEEEIGNVEDDRGDLYGTNFYKFYGRFEEIGLLHVVSVFHCLYEFGLDVL